MRTSSWLMMTGLMGLLVGSAASCSDEPGGEQLQTVTAVTSSTTSTASAGGETTTSTGGTGGTTTTAATGGAGGAATTAAAGGAGGMPPEPVCGNGKVETGEACDDSNAIPTDGCDENCKIEDGWVCNGDPSVCEMVLNGCDSVSATDMKGMSNVDITIPAQGGMLNSCIKIKTGNTVTFKMGTATQHYLVSGTWTAPDSKHYVNIGPPNENTIYCCDGTPPSNIANGPFNASCCGSPFDCCTSSEMFTLPKGANPWFDDKAQDSKIRGAIYVED